MNNEQKHCCDDMTDTLNEKRAHIGYSPKTREYHIDLQNESMIVYIILYCPWCGKQLPTSLREEWFSILENEYNIDHPRYEEQEKLIPEEFKSDEWWKTRGL